MTEQNPVVVITGAGSGIGAATARALGKPGARLVLHTGRNASGLEAVAETLRAKGAEVATVLGDLADPAVPASVIEAARQAFGRVDQIVSNAGRAQKSAVADLTSEDLTRAFEMMPLAFFRLVQAALPDLNAAQGQGRVVAVSSFVAHGYGTGGMLFPASAAAKAALEALAKSLAIELGPKGVTVNCVVPGFVRKDATGHAATSSSAMEAMAGITPNGRIAEPSDIAEMVAWLLSPMARHVTGQNFHVDGGLLLP